MDLPCVLQELTLADTYPWKKQLFYNVLEDSWTTWGMSGKKVVSRRGTNFLSLFKRQKYFPTHTFSVYKDFQKNSFSENMPCWHFYRILSILHLNWYSCSFGVLNNLSYHRGGLSCQKWLFATLESGQTSKKQKKRCSEITAGKIHRVGTGEHVWGLKSWRQLAKLFPTNKLKTVNILFKLLLSQTIG